MITKQDIIDLLINSLDDIIDDDNQELFFRCVESTKYKYQALDILYQHGSDIPIKYIEKKIERFDTIVKKLKSNVNMPMFNEMRSIKKEIIDILATLGYSGITTISTKILKSRKKTSAKIDMISLMKYLIENGHVGALTIINNFDNLPKKTIDTCIEYLNQLNVPKELRYPELIKNLLNSMTVDDLHHKEISKIKIKSKKELSTMYKHMKYWTPDTIEKHKELIKTLQEL